MDFRRKAREIALRILFQSDIDGTLGKSRFENVEQQVEDTLKYLSAPENIKHLSLMLVKGVIDHIAEIDEIIEASAENWSLIRLSTIDRNVLRIAVYEMKFVETIPPKASINEAIEIAKKYGTENSSKFVNGVLDRVLRELEQPEESFNFGWKGPVHT